MKKLHILIAITTLLCSAPCLAQEKKNPIKFNYGIKTGFQGLTYNSTNFYIDGYLFNNNTIQSNKVGYTLTPFLRLTKNKFYLQTEAAFGISHHYYDFQATDDEGTDIVTPEYKLDTYCVKIPLLLGYNFINHTNYGMSFYTGPRVKLTFTSLCEQEFSGFKYENMYEEIEKDEWFWEFGLGIKIYNVIVDFTYDWGFIRQDSKIHAPAEGLTFTSKRSNNILSFSAGFIF